MLKLTLLRSRPQQGELVKVYVMSETAGKCGEVLLSFEEWIQFNKTIKEGVENLTRKHELQMDVRVQPLEETDTGKLAIPTEHPRIEVPTVQPVTKEVSEEEVARALKALEKETNDL